MKTHSSIPWTAYHTDVYLRWGNKVAECLKGNASGPEGYYRIDESEALANAEYIVHCVNTHQSLVDALEAVLPIVKQYITEAGGCDHSVGICMCEEIAVAEQAQEALKQAKEREA